MVDCKIKSCDFHSKENDYECGVLGRGPQIILVDEKAVCELYTS